VKEQIANLILSALNTLDLAPPAKGVVVEHTRDTAHGDFASNIALMSAKAAGKNPRQLAEAIIAALPADAAINKTEIAGPGFINFFVNAAATNAVIANVLRAGERYGESNQGDGQSVHIEYVSANPTGPLHVGHGRGAAFGASLANVLAATGYKVHREYYVNDAGRQMDILATSIWLRYLEHCGEAITFPTNGYKSEGYIFDIAQQLAKNHAEKFRQPASQVMADLPPDEGETNGDKEAHIDALINRAKALLGSDYNTVFDTGLNTILADIRDDLSEFGVTYEEWFSERSLTGAAIDQQLAQLRAGNWLYEKNGALWFKSSELGDEKDRVVIRDNGLHTYFASDIAYHLNKLDRGFKHIIDIWGADHHGYIPRVKAALKAADKNVDQLTVKLVQFAVLYRGAEKVPMSTRSGQFVTLRDLRKEVGNDAARFFYVLRSSDQHLDFDLELAKSQSNDNPVYYIQYANARICRVFGDKLIEKNWTHAADNGLANLDQLTTSHEQALIKRLAQYPETVAASAKQFAPHHIAHYLRELAQEFHSYYNAQQFLVDDTNVRDARLALISAVQHVIQNGLALLGVRAPESM